MPTRGAQGRRTCPFYPRYFPSAAAAPLLQSPQHSGPGHLRTDPVPPRSTSRANPPDYLLILTGPARAAEPRHLHPHQRTCTDGCWLLPRASSSQGVLSHRPSATPTLPLTRDPIAAEGRRLLPRRPSNQTPSRWGRGLTLDQPFLANERHRCLGLQPMG